MSKMPFFKFYPADWLTGTSLMHPVLKGGYIDLLCHQWKHGGIPDDESTIIRLSGIYPGICPGITPGMLLAYFPVDAESGLRKNIRLEEERKRIEGFSSSQRDKAEKGWEKRRAKDAPAYAPADAPADAPASKNDAILEVRSQKSDIQNTDDRDQNSESNNVRAQGTHDPDFENFWVLYPADSRRKKQICKTIYLKAVAEHGNDQLIRQALENYKQSKNYKEGYIQNSTTWYRDWQTWLDYIPGSNDTKPSWMKAVEEREGVTINV